MKRMVLVHSDKLLLSSSKIEFAFEEVNIIQSILVYNLRCYQFFLLNVFIVMSLWTCTMFS